MKNKSMSPSAILLALTVFCSAGSASAVPLLCDDASAKPAVDHLPLSSCPNAGVSVDDSLWKTRTELLLNFQPNGGEKLETWFVYFFNPLLENGHWRFEKIVGDDGHLSQIKLIGDSTVKNVPEPGTLALLGLGLLGAGIARRRKRA